MSNQFSYYTAENMQDKKLSDLRTDRNFLRDGVTFLKSGRKGYTDEEISEMSADDVVSEVLEHFRYQTVNEVTMAKDMYYLKDNTVNADEKQSFGRLMFAFDNAKHFESTDKMALSIQQSVDLQNASRFFWVTAVIEYDWSTFLGGTSAEYGTTP